MFVGFTPVAAGDETNSAYSFITPNFLPPSFLTSRRCTFSNRQFALVYNPPFTLHLSDNYPSASINPLFHAFEPKGVESNGFYSRFLPKLFNLSIYRYKLLIFGVLMLPLIYSTILPRSCLLLCPYWQGFTSRVCVGFFV